MKQTAREEKPIIFSGPMVEAILDGMKTQTRRVTKGIPPDFKLSNGDYFDSYNRTDLWNLWTKEGKVGFPEFKCPYGSIGTKLWVRETFTIESNWEVDTEEAYPPPFKDGRPIKRVEDEYFGSCWKQCHYRATDPEPELVLDGLEEPGCRWKPSIHMPRWASRINLEVTDIRVERLQDISLGDCRREGMESGDYIRSAFEKLWDDINKSRGFGWEKNSWVWAITFKREGPDE